MANLMNKILVTGGAGFIGVNLLRLLVAAKGLEVVNLDSLTYAGRVESLAELEGHPRYCFERVDLADAAQLSVLLAKHRPHAVIHLAAESHVDRSIDGPGVFMQTNVIGSFNLLQACLRYWQALPVQAAAGQAQPSQASFRMLHVSSDEVYGSLAPDAAACSETSRYAPRSPYAASKAAADHLVRAWGVTYGLPVLVTHSSNNYGPYQFPEKLIPLVILKCLRREPIPLYGDGQHIRDWLHVEDHCEALYAVLLKGRVGQTYNIAADQQWTNLELVNKLCVIVEQELEALAPVPQAGSASVRPSGAVRLQDLITFVTDRRGHDRRYAINTRRIREQLGWQPQRDFESGLRATVQWYLANRDWWQAIVAGPYNLQRMGCGGAR